MRHTDSNSFLFRAAKLHTSSGGVLEGLGRLAQLISTDNHILRSMEARLVVDGLETLLFTALEHLSAAAERMRGYGGRSYLPVSENLSVHTHHSGEMEVKLNLMRSLLTSSSQVFINMLRRRTQRLLCRGKQGTIADQQRKRKRIAIDEGLLLLTSLSQSRLPPAAPVLAISEIETSSCAHFEAAGQEFLGTVTFFPANPLSTLMIVASVRQQEVGGGGTYCGNPEALR